MCTAADGAILIGRGGQGMKGVPRAMLGQNHWPHFELKQLRGAGMRPGSRAACIHGELEGALATSAPRRVPYRLEAHLPLHSYHRAFPDHGGVGTSPPRRPETGRQTRKQRRTRWTASHV